MNGHRHSNTDPYGRTGVGLPPKDEAQKGVVFDLAEVRRRLKENKDPTTKDLLEALEAERAHSDSLGVGLGQVRRDIVAMDAHFAANVAEVVKPMVTKAIGDGRFLSVRAFTIVFGLFVLVASLVGGVSLFKVSSVQSEVQGLHQELASKADKAQVAKLGDLLRSKADKVQVDKRLLEIEAKADKSVVERLSAELKTKDGAHDQRLNDLATDLMSKADKAQVAKLAARLRSTRAQVNVLQKRVQDLQDAAQPPPTAVEPQASTRPKTM